MIHFATRRKGAVLSQTSRAVLMAALIGMGGQAFAQELGIPQASDAAAASGPATLQPAPVTHTPDGQVNIPATAEKDGPVFIMSSFLASSQNTLSLFASDDGTSFHTLRSEAYTPANSLLRDPSIIHHTDGYYYVVYTTDWNGSDFGVLKSKNLKDWEFVRHVPVALEGVTNTWAPEWFRDTDGSLKVIVSLSKNSTGGPFGAYMIEVSDDLSQWSAPIALEGLQGNYIDTFVVANDDGSGYTAFTKNETTKFIELATAKSLRGPWKLEKTGDWAGWGGPSEGQALVKLPDGGWRIYFDDYMTKHYWYSDSHDGFRTWTPKKEIGGVSGSVRHFTVLSEDRKTYAEATKPAGTPKTITWDQHSMMVDGERIVVWSGEIHPFRLPSPSLWRDVIQKMKASGFNGVAFYFDWGYHSSAPGVYDFSNVRNVERALEIAAEEGMYVIARTGPYVNAELTGGGYPGWMLRQRGEARTDDPLYLAATDEWMSQINPIIARHQLTTGGGTVIAYQLENELGKVEPKHVRQMEHLAKKAREDGITVPFFHNAAGRLPDWTPKNSTAPWANSGPTDMYAFDGYPGGTCNVHADPSGPSIAPDWGIYGKGGTKVGSLSSPNTPGFAAELGGGWFDYWGSNGTYDCTSKRQGVGYQRVFYGTNLINRITIHNIYMTFGGTSWGWLAGPVVYTSYDYGAAISEDRGLRDKAYALKQQGMFVQAAEKVLGEMDKGPVITPSSDKVQIYHNINPSLGTHVLFAVHNPSNRLTDDAFSFDLTTKDGSYKIASRLNGQDAKFFLAAYEMERQHLVYSTSELQTHLQQGERDVVLLQGRTGEAGETVLRYSSAPKVTVLSGKVSSKFDAKKGDLRLNYTHQGLTRVLISGGGRAPMLLLLADEPTSWRFWRQDTEAGAVLQHTPALVRHADLNGTALALTGDTTEDSTIDIWSPVALDSVTFNGEALHLTPQADGSYQTTPVRGPEAFTLPKLADLDWTRRFDSLEADPAFDDSQWVRADNRASAAQTWTTPERGQPTLSMSDYGFHHGDVWYRGRVTIDDLKNNRLELFYGAGGAGMIQVWFDGKYVGMDELDTGRSFPETNDSVTFTLPVETTGEHVIAIQVRNNAHNWDLMADDYHREARGLIAANLTSKAGQRFAVPIEWRIQGNKGGEKIADLVRGPMNNGGLYGEREGWYLPVAAGSTAAKGWDAVKTTDAPPAPGTYWLRTTFNLDLPKDHDIQLGLSFGDTTKPRSERENRVLIFVNGWNMGQFIAHIGPQRTFVIPPGILNPNGENTIALAVTTDGKPENALEPVELVNLRTARGGVPLEIMPASRSLQR